MSELFNSGIGYSGINTAKSALSSLIGIVANIDIGSHLLVRRFMKGIFNKKPSLPKYNVTWPVNTVLNFIQSLDNNSCSLRDISKKLVTVGPYHRPKDPNSLIDGFKKYGYRQ